MLNQSASLPSDLSADFGAYLTARGALGTPAVAALVMSEKSDHGKVNSRCLRALGPGASGMRLQVSLNWV